MRKLGDMQVSLRDKKILKSGQIYNKSSYQAARKRKTQRQINRIALRLTSVLMARIALVVRHRRLRDSTQAASVINQVGSGHRGIKRRHTKNKKTKKTKRHAYPFGL